MRGLRVALLVGGIVAGGLHASGCGRRDEPPNVLLISLDTLRADRLGCYGSPRDTSPTLDRLAAEGVLFEHATAPATWTIPSHASLFSGVYPSVHRVRSYTRAVPEEYPVLPSLLRDRGYATAGVLNLEALRNMKRGFDSVWIVPHAEDEHGAADRVRGVALAWLEETARPFFLFLHIYDAHSAYRPAPEYARRFAEPYDGPFDGATEQLQAVRLGRARIDAVDARHLLDLYDAGIRQLDDALARLFDALESGGHLRNTVVVVTSDHGEEFLEHGSVLHGRTLHQELVRVPLIFWGAGVPRGVRVQQPVSLVDVLPTVISLVGGDPPPGVAGIDLSPLWQGTATDGERLIFSEADHWIGKRNANLRRSVRRGPWTLHYDAASDHSALYHLPDDPLEQRDVAAERPGLVRLLRGSLRPYVRTPLPGPQPEPPADLVELLQGLGYVDDDDAPEAVREPAP